MLMASPTTLLHKRAQFTSQAAMTSTSTDAIILKIEQTLNVLERRPGGKTFQHAGFILYDAPSVS